MPSAARRLTALEAQQLGATAKALPDGWVVHVEAPHGQLALVPARDIVWQVGTWFADKRIGACRRTPYRPAA